MLLEFLDHIIQFVRVLGCGASRFAHLAVVREPQNAAQKRLLQIDVGWHEGQELVLKLLHTVDGDLPSIAGVHNDPNFREHKAVIAVRRGCSQNSRVSKSAPTLMPVFPGKASAGYIKCSRTPDSRIVTFLAVEYVGGTWYGSQRSAQITSSWRNEGVLDEGMRLYARGLLFCAHWFHEKFGIVVMDFSRANIYEHEIQENWLRHADVKAQMPKPQGIGVCDLGSSFEIGTSSQRAAGEVCRYGTAPVLKVLSRSKTNEVTAKASELARPRMPKGGTEGVIVLGNAAVQNISLNRQAKGKGLARTTTGTPENRCEILAGALKGKNSSDPVLKPSACIEVDCGAVATMIFSELRPRRKDENVSDYNQMKLAAALSPEAMQRAIESSVKHGATVKQPDTVANLSNLLYWMLQPEIARRKGIQDALCHPFVSMPVLPPTVYQATRNGGYLFPAGRGPEGSPWAGMEIPGWIVKNISGKGLGAFPAERIPFSTTKPAALYCGFDFIAGNGESISEWPPGRYNISLNANATEMCIGELPIDVLRDRNAPGSVFNAGNSKTNNLRLDRLSAWRDKNGLIYLAYYTLKGDIETDVEGLWCYPHMNGQGAKFSFDDSKFIIH